MKEERKPCLHAHVKWFYGQSERAYHLNYFIMRYSARSLRHRYEHTQFTILFKEELKKIVLRALWSYISPWEFLRTLEKSKKHSPSARASPHFSRVLKNFRVLKKKQCTRRVFHFFNSVNHTIPCVVYLWGEEKYEQ